MKRLSKQKETGVLKYKRLLNAVRATVDAYQEYIFPEDENVPMLTREAEEIYVQCANLETKLGEYMDCGMPCETYEQI